jgi:hypothetical protein
MNARILAKNVNNIQKKITIDVAFMSKETLASKENYKALWPHYSRCAQCIQSTKDITEENTIYYGLQE